MPEEYQKNPPNNSAWLRAAVLGANDGILSVSSIVTGMASANSSSATIFLAGMAALAAGATSMATGEYVSVSSQADSEQADLTRERDAIESDPQGQLEELVQIYIQRGLSSDLAREVAVELMSKDPLLAHARDELGITQETMARPLQAAFASALSFIAGGIIPLIVASIFTRHNVLWAVIISSLLSLGVLGALGAFVGRVKILRPILRIVSWGVVSMGITAVVGSVFKVAV